MWLCGEVEVIGECAMNLSAEEAINRVNELVTVEMLVQRTKCCTGSSQVFLDSEASYRDPKNLGIVVTEGGRADSPKLALTTRPPTSRARRSEFMGW